MSATTPFALPLHAFRLLGLSIVPLVAWFSLGYAGRYLMLIAGAQLSHGEWRQARLVLVIFIFTLMVMLQAIVIIGMLHSLRGRLLETRIRREGGQGDESLGGAINRSILVFVVLYEGWGLHVQDAKDFLGMDFVRNQDIAISAFKGEQSEAGRAFIDLDARISLGIAAGTVFVRWVLNRFARRDFVFLFFAVLPFLELAAAFYALTGATTLVTDLVETRAAFQWWGEVWATLEAMVPAWSEVWPYIAGGVLLPLVWLTLGMVVYGARVEDTDWALSKGRLRHGYQRYEQRAHVVTKTGLGKILERWEHVLPIINALRLTVRGGLPLFGMFCLCFVAVQVGTDHVARGVRYLIGSEEPFYWLVYTQPIDFAQKLLFTALTLCVAAAAYDIAEARDRLISGERAGPDRSAPSRRPRPSSS